MLTCNVCNEQRAVGVANGACGPVSYAYCRDCLKAGAEPWQALVVYAGCAGVPPGEPYAEWFEQVIEINLAFHGKTREEFDEEAQKVSREYEESLRQGPTTVGDLIIEAVAEDLVRLEYGDTDPPRSVDDFDRDDARRLLRIALEAACTEDEGPNETSENGSIIGWDRLCAAAYPDPEESS